MDTEKEQQLSIRAWRITRRWQEFEGEIRTAILRVALVAGFYAVQLVHYLVLAAGNEQEQLFHRQSTIIAAIWLFVSLGVLVCLRQRCFPAALKFVTSSLDICLLTICAALGAGPASPLVGCYYLIIAAAALRLSLPLIWYTTLTSMAGYMWLVGIADPTWFDAAHTTPLVRQLITLLAMAGTGTALGQLVRMIASSATEFFNRFRHLAQSESSASEPSYE